MATDQAPRAVGASGVDEPAKRVAVELTPVQVVAGSLAAVSATVASSALGLAGTLIGAALAGVVVTVTNAVYIHSLNRTREKIRTLPSGRYIRRRAVVPQGSHLVAATAGGHAPASVPDVEHVVDRRLAGEAVADVTATREVPARRAAAPRIRAAAPGWAMPASSAAAVIVVTVVAIAVLEVSTGRTLGGLFESGRAGSTVTALMPGGAPYQANLGAGRTPVRRSAPATSPAAPLPAGQAPSPEPAPSRSPGRTPDPTTPSPAPSSESPATSTPPPG